MKIISNGIEYIYEEKRNGVLLFSIDNLERAIAASVTVHDTEQIFCIVEGIEHQIDYFKFANKPKAIAEWMAGVL